LTPNAERCFVRHAVLPPPEPITMRMPDAHATYAERVRYGRYLGRRLRRAKRTTLATDVEAATTEILQRGRQCEDALGPVQDARADRDAADDELDDIAQDSRAKLAGRSADAMKNAPYTLIFPDGIDYYLAAPLNQETTRYGELAQRLAEHLDEEDDIRKNAVPAITAGIAAFRTASEAVEHALTAEALAFTRLDAAEEAWSNLVTKVYGVLIADLGKKAADRFFPKIRSKKDSTESP
jgi:hypothetical protein